MKKVITLFSVLFIIISQSQAQSILPKENQEYCPNTEYSFVITVPGTVNSLTPSGGAFVVSRNGNNFVGKFNDANLKQTFIVTYTDNSSGADVIKPFEFKKIKSLFYNNQACGLIQPNLAIINAAGCQINTIPINFSNIQWHTASESTASCFGSVTQYEYQIPVGWKIGNTTCMNSSQWIPGSNNVSIITDANSGDGASVKIRPVNTSCSSSLIPGYNQTISIPVKRNPIFTINPSSFEVPCGTPTTKTVSVNMSIPTGCSVSYNWSLSSPYTYAYPTGGFVPQTFTTATPSFTFSIPSYSGVLPTISVTPVVDGVSQTTLICTASRSPINASQYPDFTIIGPNSICSSENYSVSNVPAGFSINWYTSTYPYGASVAQINSPTSVQTSITAIGTGVISLIATITNQCGQQISITKSNISVGGGASSITGYFTNYLGQYENLKTNYQGLNYIKPNYWTTVVVSNPELSSATWSHISGGYNYWTQSQTPTVGTVLQMSLPVTNNIVLYRLTNNGTCGSQTFDFLFWAKEAPYTPNYSLYPNPANDIITVESLSNSEDSLQIDQVSKLTSSSNTKNKNLDKQSTIKLIEIMDYNGNVHYHKDCTNLFNNTLTIPVDKLENGNYLLKIFNGNEWKTEKIIIQH